MARGVLVDEVHDVLGLPKSELSRLIIAAACETRGCSTASATLESLTFVRVYRPLGATIFGLLWVKSSERFTVLFLDDYRGLRVHVTGRLPKALHERIVALATQRQSVPTTVTPTTAPPGPFPVAPAVRPQPSADRAWHPAPPAPPAPPRWEPLGDATEPRRPSGPASTSGAAGPIAAFPAAAPMIVLRPPVGPDLVIAARTLIGRDPVARPGEAPAQMFRIDDLSVSKTHAAIEVEDGAVWIVDRSSTNGTAVIDPDGAERRLVPDHRERVVVGQRVRVGSCEFTVTER